MSDPLYEFFRRLLFLPEPVSDVAREIDRLHFFVISVTMLGATVVFATGLWFMIRYRRRDERAGTPFVRAGVFIELGVSGGLLTLFLLWWVIGFRQYTRILTPPRKALQVYVTAKQWMWKFAESSGRSSVGVLVVPRGQPVRLLITSRDVIHSFYVPALRLKQDAVPGRYTQFWFTADHEGDYPIFCAEYCGLDHSRMWARVVVVSPEDYQRWIGGEVPEAVARASSYVQRPDLANVDRDFITLAEQGRLAASRYDCFSCHTVDGQPHIGPTWQGLYGSVVELAGGQHVLADENYLTRSMMDPNAEVVRGFQPVMPTFQGTLAQPDAAAIVEYIRSLRNVPPAPPVALPRVQVTNVTVPQGNAPSPPGTARPGEGTENEPFAGAQPGETGPQSGARPSSTPPDGGAAEPPRRLPSEAAPQRPRMPGVQQP